MTGFHPPLTGRLWCERAEALVALGHQEQAIAAYRQAMRVEPSYVDAHLALASMLLRMKEACAAALVLRAGVAGAADMSRDRELHHLLAEALHAAGRSGEAQGHADKAIALGDDTPSMIRLTADLMRRQGRVLESVEALSRVVAVQQDDADVRIDLAEQLIQLGRFREAAEHLQSAIVMAQTVDQTIRAAGALRMSDPRTAIEVLVGVIHSHPEIAAAHLNLALALEAEGAVAEAIESLRMSVSLEATPRVQFHLGRLLVQTGATAEARSLLLKAATGAPEDEDISAVLAELIGGEAYRLPRRPTPAADSSSGEVLGTDLAVFSFCDMLEFLRLQHATGVLVIQSQHTDGFVNLMRGDLLWAHATSELTLERALAIEGCATDVLPAVRGTATDEPVLAHSLLINKVVEVGTMKRALRREADAAVGALIRLRAGTISFLRRPEGSMHMVAPGLVMNAQEILFDAMRLLDEKSATVA